MEKILDIKKIYIAVLLVACLILVFQLFSKCENEKLQMANIEALNSQAKFYKLKNGQLVTSVENLTYTNNQLKKSVLMKDKKVKELTDKFSKVKTITKYITYTKFDTIMLPYKDTIPCNFDIRDSVSKKWYNIAYKSTQRGIEINKLNIPDSVIVVSGTKRKWFWGKTTNVTDITHSNPYIHTTNAQHVEVKEKTKWYDTTIIKIAIGFVSGLFLSK